MTYLSSAGGESTLLGLRLGSGIKRSIPLDCLHSFEHITDVTARSFTLLPLSFKNDEWELAIPITLMGL